jgi:hypothetical protein
MESVAGPEINVVKPGKKAALIGDECSSFEKCLTLDETSTSLYMEGIDDELQNVRYIDEVLTAKECEALCQLIDRNESLSFWAESRSDKLEVFRNADTIEFESHLFAFNIWERVKHLLADMKLEILDDESDPNWERELVGDWLPCGLNYDMLFAKYPSDGSFSPHTDGRAIHGFNYRSFYSVIIFLKDIPIEKGGGTRFYLDSAVSNLFLCTIDGREYWTADSSLITGEVASVAGRLLYFHQSLVHEGVPVHNYQTCKYIIRTDIMFLRSPAICDQEKDRKAYTMFRKAEELAEEGLISESISLFSKALKLSPDMARIMGQA